MISVRGRSQSEYLLAGGACLFGFAAGMLTARILRGPAMTNEDHVRERLPLAHNLKTVPDADANYDLDGVSFDTEGVIVASDNSKELRI